MDFPAQPGDLRGSPGIGDPGHPRGNQGNEARGDGTDAAPIRSEIGQELAPLGAREDGAQSPPQAPDFGRGDADLPRSRGPHSSRNLVALLSGASPLDEAKYADGGRSSGGGGNNDGGGGQGGGSSSGVGGGFGGGSNGGGGGVDGRRGGGWSEEEEEDDLDGSGGGSRLARQVYQRAVLHNPSVSAWVHNRRWKDLRSMHEARVLAATVDALVAVGVPFYCDGLEIPLRRLAGLQLVDDGEPWELLQAIDTVGVDSNLLPRMAFDAAIRSTHRRANLNRKLHGGNSRGRGSGRSGANGSSSSSGGSNSNINVNNRGRRGNAGGSRH